MISAGEFRNGVTFEQDGQVLQVRGRWSRQASIDHLSEILAFSDRWNRERSAPKVYVRVHDDGRVHVLTEVSVPVVAGLLVAAEKWGLVDAGTFHSNSPVAAFRL